MGVTGLDRFKGETRVSGREVPGKQISSGLTGVQPRLDPGLSEA